MATRIFRVSLAEDTRDFQQLALEPGLPLLDKSNVNYQILARWLGPLIAEPEWRGESVNFFIRHPDQGRLHEVEVTSATDADLSEPLKEDFQLLEDKLHRAQPETSTEHAVYRCAAESLLKLSAKDADSSIRECSLFKYKLDDGPWRLVWCWGFQRKDMQPAPTVVCSHLNCRQLFLNRPGSKGKCPGCLKRPIQKAPAGAGVRVPVSALLLLLLLGGIGAGIWLWNQSINDQVALIDPASDTDNAQELASDFANQSDGEVAGTNNKSLDGSPLSPNSDPENGDPENGDPENSDPEKGDPENGKSTGTASDDVGGSGDKDGPELDGLQDDLNKAFKNRLLRGPKYYHMVRTYPRNIARPGEIVDTTVYRKVFRRDEDRGLTIYLPRPNDPAPEGWGKIPSGVVFTIIDDQIVDNDPRYISTLICGVGRSRVPYLVKYKDPNTEKIFQKRIVPDVWVRNIDLGNTSYRNNTFTVVIDVLASKATAGSRLRMVDRVSRQSGKWKTVDSANTVILTSPPITIGGFNIKYETLIEVRSSDGMIKPYPYTFELTTRPKSTK